MITHNPASTPLFVPEEIGPQRRELITAFDRLARHGSQSWKGMVELNEDFFDVPAVHGLLITQARQALDEALVATGRADAHAKVLRYATEMVKAIARDVVSSMGPKAGVLREIAARGIADRLLISVDHALSGLVVRDLMSERGFTRAHYEQLTGPWFFSLGQLHAEDSGYVHAPLPPLSLLPPEVRKGLGPRAGPHIQAVLHTVPTLTYEQIQALTAAFPLVQPKSCADFMMVVSHMEHPVQKKAFEQVKARADELCWRLAQELLPRYEMDERWHPTPVPWQPDTDAMGELIMLIRQPVHQTLAGLMFRERMRPGRKDDQRDYDCATGAWRAAIGPVHPNDHTLHVTE